MSDTDWIGIEWIMWGMGIMFLGGIGFGIAKLFDQSEDESP
jgi:hypothetical protein